MTDKILDSLSELKVVYDELMERAELNTKVGLFMLESKFRSNAITIEAAQRSKDLSNFLEKNVLKIQECLKLL